MIDFKLTTAGDLSLSGQNEIEFVKKDSLKRQYAIARVKSIRNDWYIDNIGADLESLLGLPNDTQTIELGKSLILTALTDDGLFGVDEVYIQYVEESHSTELKYYVFLRIGSIEESTMLTVTLSPINGVQV